MFVELQYRKEAVSDCEVLGLTFGRWVTSKDCDSGIVAVCEFKKGGDSIPSVSCDELA